MSVSSRVAQLHSHLHCATSSSTRSSSPASSFVPPPSAVKDSAIPPAKGSSPDSTNLLTTNDEMGDAASMDPVFQIIPGVQCYDWGIKGSESRVAKFAVATKQLNFEAGEEKPCAELWMGTHPSLPSRVLPGSTVSSSRAAEECPTLSSHLERRPELIGKAVLAKFPDEEPGCLPFLFKVLSVGKALSIQAHPDKQLARRLHEQRPDVYKDPNHKPEMAIALTPFAGFCGFRPLSEIAHFYTHVAEFAELCSLSASQAETLTALAHDNTDPSSPRIKAILKALFSNLMNAPASRYQLLTEAIANRFRHASASSLSVSADERELLLTLNASYPHDIGIFCLFLLNVNHLQPGEAMFLQANEPHAYLHGEILECMAASDNVVRAGLTPKLRDVDTLLQMCTYQSGSSLGLLPPSNWPGARGEGETKLYSPPIEEFDVLLSTLPEGTTQQQEGVQGPSIILVLKGSVEARWDGGGTAELPRGTVWFVAAGTAVSFTSVSGRGEAQWTRAFVQA